MSGHVFVSYGRSDRERARRLARLLDERGFDVWWDPKIEPGVAYDRIIERALRDAGCVVVLWSAESVESDWVRAEADDGRKRGLLVPVLIEPVDPPLQFRLIETLDLSGWAIEDDPPTFERFAESVARHVPPVEWMTRWRSALVAADLHRVPLEPQRQWVSSVRFLDDTTVMSAGGDGVLRTWSLPTGRPSGTVQAHDGSAWCIAPDGAFVVTGGADAAVRVWDSATLDPAHTLSGHGGWVLGCAASRHGEHIASGSRDSSIRLWETGGWTERTVLAGHRGAVWSTAFTADGDHLVSASDDQTARVWSVPDGAQLRVMRGHGAPVMACLPLPDGETVLSAGYDRRVLRWNLRTGEVEATLEGSAGWILSLAATPDGSLAIAGTSMGTLLAWDLATGALVASLAPHRGPVMSVDFRARIGLVSGSADETAAVWRIRPFELA